jgi:hypothetical protein
MSERSPIEKLLLYADSQGRIPWGEAARWAKAFGFALPDIFFGPDPDAWRIAAAFQPSPRRDLPFAFLFEVVVQAYAEGWIGLDRVLGWADEWKLSEAETMKLLKHCAIAGHDHQP